eukprot:m.285016 g.285016  ORF g.285016 m.285016 type:complete len:75 (+) comp143768_c0_seq1:1-225(+)
MEGKNMTTWPTSYGPQFWGAVHFNCDFQNRKFKDTWRVFQYASKIYKPEWLNGFRDTPNCFRLYPEIVEYVRES